MPLRPACRRPTVTLSLSLSLSHHGRYPLEPASPRSCLSEMPCSIAPRCLHHVTLPCSDRLHGKAAPRRPRPPASGRCRPTSPTDRRAGPVHAPPLVHLPRGATPSARPPPPCVGFKTTVVTATPHFFFSPSLFFPGRASTPNTSSTPPTHRRRPGDSGLRRTSPEPCRRAPEPCRLSQLRTNGLPPVNKY
jgi:hypothetical protein